MANAFAMIDEAIWRKDRDFRALPRYAQCTFLQVLSQRDVDCAGILTLHVDLLAKGCDELSTEHIWADLKALEQARFIYYDTDTDELLIRSYLRRVAARSPNVLKGALKAARAVVSPKLRSVLAQELRRLNKAEATNAADEIDAGWNPSETPPQTVPEPLRNPSERGNPSETLPEPPICSSVESVASPTVVGHLGEARSRGPARTDHTPPTPDPNDPPRYCPDHMPHGTPNNCGPCRGHRRQHDHWLAQQDVDTRAAIQAQARAEAAQRQADADARAQAIDACPLGCDEDGYLNGQVCNHNPQQAETNKRGIQAVKAALKRTPADEPDNDKEPETDTTPTPTDTDEPPY